MHKTKADATTDILRRPCSSLSITLASAMPKRITEAAMKASAIRHTSDTPRMTVRKGKYALNSLIKTRSPAYFHVLRTGNAAIVIASVANPVRFITAVEHRTNQIGVVQACQAFFQ